MKKYVINSFIYENRRYEIGEKVDVTDEMLAMFGEEYFTDKSGVTDESKAEIKREIAQLKEQGQFREVINTIERGDSVGEIAQMYPVEVLTLTAVDLGVDVGATAVETVENIRAYVNGERSKKRRDDDDSDERVRKVVDDLKDENKDRQQILDENETDDILYVAKVLNDDESNEFVYNENDKVSDVVDALIDLYRGDDDGEGGE